MLVVCVDLFVVGLHSFDQFSVDPDVCCQKGEPGFLLSCPPGFNLIPIGVRPREGEFDIYLEGFGTTSLSLRATSLVR